jgi:hypothetical protein
MDNNATNTVKKLKITYFNCNAHTFILMAIIVPVLITTGLIMKLSVYSEHNQLLRVCDPIDFFWGNNTVCKNFIKKTVNNAVNTDSFYVDNLIHSEEECNDAELFNYYENKTHEFADNSHVMSSKYEYKNNNFNDFTLDNFKKNMIANYLAIIDFIHSFNELIILLMLKLSNIIFYKLF